ncbi:MAG TPA: BREX system P-loop protein BrxC [Thermoanaerobaculia bacterium]|jgi:hypothetical protein|nr:BREX system P-loop protein BrxC [Thermoanaerobaculia bacterium]
MLIRDLFVSDVTRDIPPVVYFHEQSPEKLQAEVSEYIITGGWNQDHPNHRRVPNGIHEQYVRLLNGIAEELDKPGGPELPTSWISGFYGSGKSSFAKLLGLALDGGVLPDGRSLAAALLDRDRTPRAQELKDAWATLLRKIEPIAVVFDIGGVARDNEHIHAAALRQVQRRLGYCSTEPLVADFELKLERDGEWPRFEKAAAEELGQPWAEVKDKALAEEAFSQVMNVLYPDRYTDPMSWFTARAGTHQRAESPEDAVVALGDMLRFRQPRATLFLVIDEVSQYVLSSKDRLDRLRAFATALGARLKGKAWLLALGQQKLDEEAGDAFLVWAKDRFPPRLRVHLDPTNIRDVVHRRLLQKKPDAEKLLRELFEKHRPDLKLFAYGCENITAEEFVEVYPMLPGHIDLLLQITSALRTRSLRAQGDDQAIRGLLQLLGELFRARKLADKEVGSLVTLDEIYEIQHTALDSDVQASMARLLSQCAGGPELNVRVAKAVALLELIQETLPTDSRLVAQCLFDRLDRGSQESEVTQALEDLRSRNLLGYSEKLGYKIQSSAAEEWERERRDLRPSSEVVSQIVQDALEILLASPELPRLQGRPFAWAGVFSDGRRFEDKPIVQRREDAVVRVDFRFLPREERTDSTWVRRSAENALMNRLVWVCGDTDQLGDLARDLGSSRNMVKKYRPRRDSLNPPRRQLLQEEETRSEDLLSKVRDAVAEAWMAGRLYFRSRTINPREHGSTFPLALHAIGERLLPDLYSFFVSTVVTPGELLQLIPQDLSGPPVKFLGELGILEMDQGRYVPMCSGEVPRRVLDFIEAEDGLSGTTLLSHFGEPPYGYTPEVVKACVAGLLRGSKLRIQPEGGNVITAVRDPGVRDLFEKDRLFRRAHFVPAGADDIGYHARARISLFFKEHLAFPMDREDQAIADAVANLFPQQARRLREVIRQLRRIHRDPPEALSRLEEALGDCLAQSRWTQDAVQRVKKHLDTLRDGIQLLNIYEAELTEEAVLAVREATLIEENELAQLRESEAFTSELEAAGARLQAHLALERPWRDLRDVEADVKLIRAAYIAERRRLLEWQGQQTESARSRVRAREGFATLPGEQAHSVLRPLERALTETTADPGTIAPALRDLRDPFLVALSRAEEEANEILDRILSEGAKPLIVRVDLALHNREVSTPEDVEALIGEIRERLLEQVRTGVRVRLV